MVFNVSRLNPKEKAQSKPGSKVRAPLTLINESEKSDVVDTKYLRPDNANDEYGLEVENIMNDV